MPVQKQRPQVRELVRRHPDRRKAIFHQQLQQHRLYCLGHQWSPTPQDNSGTPFYGKGDPVTDSVKIGSGIILLAVAAIGGWGYVYLNVNPGDQGRDADLWIAHHPTQYPPLPPGFQPPVVPSTTQLAAALSNMKLDTTWTKSDVASIMTVNFTIHNQNAFSVKDIAIKCVLSAPSGTIIGSIDRVVYQRVEPGEANHIDDFNMGFINSQTKSAYCSITGVVD
jgi:hypothetical protein